MQSLKDDSMIKTYIDVCLSCQFWWHNISRWQGHQPRSLSFSHFEGKSDEVYYIQSNKHCAKCFLWIGFCQGEKYISNSRHVSNFSDFGSFSRSHKCLKKEEDCIIEKVLAGWWCVTYLPCVDAKATKSIQHMTGHEHTKKRKLSLLFLIPCDLEIKPRSANLD